MGVSITAQAGVQTGRTRLIDVAPQWLSAARGSIETWLVDERHQLVLWTPACLGIGIAAYFLLPHMAAWCATILLALAIVAFGIAAGGLLGRCLIIAGLLVACGTGLSWLRAESVASARLEGSRFGVTVDGMVLAREDLDARSRWRLIIRPNDDTLPRKVRIGLRSAPAETVIESARIRLRATLSPPPGPSLPGGYDFARQAWFERIGAVGYALGPIEMVEPAPPPQGPVARLVDFRRQLTTRLRAAVGGDPGGIAAALVTGDRGGISESVTEDMRDSGLAHLLSISGLHIAIIVGGSLWIVRRVLTLSEWIALRLPVKAIAALVAASIGIGYTMLAGASVPTVRSCIATLIVLAGLCIGRQAISLRMVAAAAVLILLVRPEVLLGPSFQLSFAAVTGLVALYQSPLGRRLLAPRRDLSLPAKIVRAVWALLVTGIVAEAMLAPIALFHFGRTGLYGVFANLIAIPLTSFVVMPAAILALLFDMVGLAAPFHWLLEQSLRLLIDLAAEVASWPNAVIGLPTMPTVAFGLLVTGSLWLCLWRGRARRLAVAPLVAGTLLAVGAQPPDLFVSGDGRHVGVVEGDAVLMLRSRDGSFTSEMWINAAGASAAPAWDETVAAHCSRDACMVDLTRGGRSWRLLATRSDMLVPRSKLEPACTISDIVVSERRLPPWCRPQWLRLDRSMLARTGALALWFDPLRIDSVAAWHGDHPWATAGRRSMRQ